MSMKTISFWICESSLTMTVLEMKSKTQEGGGGVTHISRHAGMCCSNGSLFHQKSLNIGPNFYKNISKQGSIFPKIWTNVLILKKKILKMCTFSVKITCKNGYRFWSSSRTSLSKPNPSNHPPPQKKTSANLCLWLSLQENCHVVKTLVSLPHIRNCQEKTKPFLGGFWCRFK